jgi:hypothetical protein
MSLRTLDLASAGGHHTDASAAVKGPEFFDHLSDSWSLNGPLLPVVNVSYFAF